MTPQRRRAAILYAELRNFTRLSEVLEPAKVLQLANDFFTLAAKGVVAERGEVLSVQNDSLVAAFHSEGREFADWALRAAQAVGPLGKQQFVAFGDCVSIAERLVHRARTGEIVLSFDFMKALGPAVQTLGALELPPLELSNRPPMPIYGLVLETRLDFT